MEIKKIQKQKIYSCFKSRENKEKYIRYLYGEVQLELYNYHAYKSLRHILDMWEELYKEVGDRYIFGKAKLHKILSMFGVLLNDYEADTKSAFNFVYENNLIDKSKILILNFDEKKDLLCNFTKRELMEALYDEKVSVWIKDEITNMLKSKK